MKKGENVNRTEYNKTLQTALHKYGHNSQMIQAMEEMSELIIALSKWRRYNGFGAPLYNPEETALTLRQNVIEEIADVQIMLDQMIMAFNCGESVNVLMQDKAERLSIRMQCESLHGTTTAK